MTDFTLIPFGQKIADKSLVDVSNVENGLACHCICPSCETKLIANQGSVKTWHFSHAHSTSSNDTKNICKYSLWVSVALMVKQLLRQAKSIQLPELLMYTDMAKQVGITKQHYAQLDKVIIDPHHLPFSADAVLEINGYQLVIIFTHPGSKSAPFDQASLESSSKIGIIEIALNAVPNLLFNENNKGKYTQVLQQHILESNSYQLTKRWLYHPRIKPKEQTDGKLQFICPTEAEQMRAMLKKQNSYINQVQRQFKNYECKMCKSQWYGLLFCEQCQTHLYTVEQ